MSMIIGLIIRLILIFDYKKTRKYVFIILLIYAFVPSIVVTLANKLNGISLFSDLTQKTTDYTSGNFEFLGNIYMLLKLITFINLFIVFIKIRKKENNTLTNITEIVTLFSIASVNYATIMYRWCDTALILMLLSFIKYNDEFIRIKGVYKPILIASCIFFIWQQYVSISNIGYFNNYLEFTTKSSIEIFNIGER